MSNKNVTREIDPNFFIHKGKEVIRHLQLRSNKSERWIPKKCKNPVKAIREMCVECMGGGCPSDLITNCPSKECALYEFRFGRNPYRKPPSEKQLASAMENMVKLKLGKG